MSARGVIAQMNTGQRFSSMATGRARSRSQRPPELASIPPEQRAEHCEYQENGGRKQDVAPGVGTKQRWLRFCEVLGPALEMDTALGTRCRRGRDGASTARTQDRAGTIPRWAARWCLTSAIFEADDRTGHGRGARTHSYQVIAAGATVLTLACDCHFCELGFRACSD